MLPPWIKLAHIGCSVKRKPEFDAEEEGQLPSCPHELAYTELETSRLLAMDYER